MDNNKSKKGKKTKLPPSTPGVSLLTPKAKANNKKSRAKKRKLAVAAEEALSTASSISSAGSSAGDAVGSSGVEYYEEPTGSNNKRKRSGSGSTSGGSTSGGSTSGETSIGSFDDQDVDILESLPELLVNQNVTSQTWAPNLETSFVTFLFALDPRWLIKFASSFNYEGVDVRGEMKYTTDKNVLFAKDLPDNAISFLKTVFDRSANSFLAKLNAVVQGEPKGPMAKVLRGLSEDKKTSAYEIVSRAAEMLYCGAVNWLSPAGRILGDVPALVSIDNGTALTQDAIIIVKRDGLKLIRDWYTDPRWQVARVKKILKMILDTSTADSNARQLLAIKAIIATVVRDQMKNLTRIGRAGRVKKLKDTLEGTGSDYVSTDYGARKIMAVNRTSLDKKLKGILQGKRLARESVSSKIKAQLDQGADMRDDKIHIFGPKADGKGGQFLFPDPVEPNVSTRSGQKCIGSVSRTSGNTMAPYEGVNVVIGRGDLKGFGAKSVPGQYLIYKKADNVDRFLELYGKPGGKEEFHNKIKAIVAKREDEYTERRKSKGDGYTWDDFVDDMRTAGYKDYQRSLKGALRKRQTLKGKATGEGSKQYTELLGKKKLAAVTSGNGSANGSAKGSAKGSSIGSFGMNLAGVNDMDVRSTISGDQFGPQRFSTDEAVKTPTPSEQPKARTGKRTGKPIGKPRRSFRQQLKKQKKNTK